jgi:hypothetical protein
MAVFTPTGGQLVVVTTRRLEGGKPRHAPFVVAESDPAKAEDLVSKVLTADEEARAVCPLGAQTIEQFGLEQGQFTNQWWFSKRSA